MTQSQDQGKPKTVTITMPDGRTRSLRVWKLPSGVEFAVMIDYNMFYTHYVRILHPDRMGNFTIRGPQFEWHKDMPLPAIDEKGLFKLGAQMARLITVFDRCQTSVQLLPPTGDLKPLFVGQVEWKKRADVFRRREGLRKAFGVLFKHDSDGDIRFDKMEKEVRIDKNGFCAHWVERDPVTKEPKAIVPYVPYNPEGTPEQPDHSKTIKSARKLCNTDRQFLFDTFCSPPQPKTATACDAKLPDPATHAPQSVEQSTEAAQAAPAVAQS